MQRKRCSFRKVFLVLLSWIALLFLSIGFIYLFLNEETCNLYLLVPHCILIVFLSLCFLRASLMDPGYIPFGFPHEYDKEIEPKGFKPPMVKDIKINSINTKLKWCLTCKIYRYPRVSHCSICQRCVEIFDHHCPWINNCVGKRNYRCFIMFLTSTVVHGYTSVIRSILIIVKSRENIADFVPIFAIVLVCLSMVFLIPLTGLTCFHLFLISNSRTTNEHVTSKFISGLNPYDRGCAMNILSFMCKTEYPRPRYDPKKALKAYPDFFKINEKLGEQKKAVINELRGKLKKPDPKKANGDSRVSPLHGLEDCRPIAPPYTATSATHKRQLVDNKSIVVPPAPPPHASNRHSNTSSTNIMNLTINGNAGGSYHQQPIIIPPSVPPHRSNSQSETSSNTRINTPIFLHNVSPNEITKTKENSLINVSCPNMDEWPRSKRPPVLGTSGHNNSSLTQEQMADDVIIQRPTLSIKSRIAEHNSNSMNNSGHISNGHFSKDKNKLSGSMMSMNQRNRLISSGRLAQFENQSPPPEGTVEISI